MRFNIVSRKHLQEAMFGIQDRVEQNDTASFSPECHAFHLILIDRIPRRAAEPSVRIHHEAVVVAHGFHGCATRQHSLTASAVAAEIMMHDCAGQNHMITMADVLIDQDRREATRRAEILKVTGHIAVTVIHPQTASYFFADPFCHFFLRHQAMRPERENDLHVLIRNPEPIHLIDQDRHKVKAVGHTRRVIADKGHGIPRLDDLIDWLLSNRMVNRIEHGLLDVRQRLDRRHIDFLDDLALIEGKALRATAIMKSILFHPDSSYKKGRHSVSVSLIMRLNYTLYRSMIHQ